jgi:hypothetical protein
VGILQLASCIAYFQAVKARCLRHASKSASDRFGRRMAHAASKLARARSKDSEVPLRCSPGSQPG